MAKISFLLKYKIRMVSRACVSRKHALAGNFVIFLLLCLIFLDGYSGLIGRTLGTVRAGNTSIVFIMSMYSFLIWALAAVGSSWKPWSIPFPRLQIFPFSGVELFLTHLIESMLSPFLLLLLCGSFGVLALLALSANGMLFIVASLVVFLNGLVFVLLRTTFLSDGWYSLVQSILLSMLIPASVGWLEGIVGFASAEMIVLLFLWNILLGCLAARSFRILIARSVRAGNSTKDARTRGQFSTLMNAFVTKDLRYLFRMLDGYVGLLISLLFAFMLSSEPLPPISTLYVSIAIVFFINSGFAINALGCESSGSVTRYNLTPVKGEHLLLSKNLAYFAVVFIQVVPLLIVGMFRFGLSNAFVGGLLMLSIALLNLIMGNYRSIQFPFKSTFFRFTSDSSPHTLVSVLLLVLVGNVPTVATIQYGDRHGISFLLAMILLFGGYAYAKWFLPHQGKLLDAALPRTRGVFSVM